MSEPVSYNNPPYKYLVQNTPALWKNNNGVLLLPWKFQHHVVINEA